MVERQGAQNGVSPAGERMYRRSPKPRRATHSDVDHVRPSWDPARTHLHLRLQQKRPPQGPQSTLFVARQGRSSVHRDPEPHRSTGASINSSAPKTKLRTSKIAKDSRSRSSTVCSQTTQLFMGECMLITKKDSAEGRCQPKPGCVKFEMTQEKPVLESVAGT